MNTENTNLSVTENLKPIKKPKGGHRHRFFSLYAQNHQNNRENFLVLGITIKNMLYMPINGVYCTMQYSKSALNKMNRCRTLQECSLYVAKVKKYAKEKPLKKAVEQAVTECIKDGILSQFLTRYRADAISTNTNKPAHMRFLFPLFFIIYFFIQGLLYIKYYHCIKIQSIKKLMSSMGK